MTAVGDSLRVVSVADMAIDTDAMNEMGPGGTLQIIRYAETRDPSLLKFVPGEKATWFTIRRLRASEFTRFVRSAPTPNEQYMRAFSIGVTRIEDVRLLESKQTVAAYEPDGSAKRDGGTVRYYTDNQIDEISPAYVEEIGKLVYDRCFLAHAREVCFPLPPSFPLVWTERTYRNVESARRVRASQSSEQPSPTPLATASNGDGATDATVTASATP